MVRFTHTARQRELYRYFQPPSLQTKDPSTTAVQANPATSHSSSDLSLTAFAQLGALRLNAKRGIISLVGRDTEYVIAEAGRTLSLQDDNRYDDGDALWHGVGALQTKATVGMIVIELFGGPSQDSIPYLVVEDLTKDERFSNLPLVTEEPFARFLACYPLRTPAGYVIGIYAIVDDKPRLLSETELQFIQDMARTAMDHIESGRVKQQQYRAERMVKALGIFLEGGESLRNWWINQGKSGLNVDQGRMNEKLRRGVTFMSQADEEFGIQDTADPYVYSSVGKNIGAFPGSTRNVNSRGMPITPGDGRPSIPRSNSNSTGTVPTTVPSDFTLSLDQESYTSEGPPMSPGEKRSSVALGSSSFGTDSVDRNSISGKRLQDALLSSELRRVFARASNLVREAIDVDGVAFFDASIGSFGGGSERINLNAKAPGALNYQGVVEETTSSSEEERKKKASDDTGLSEEDAPAASEKTVGILGYSTRSRSSINKHSAPEAYETFSEKLLRQLTKRYPNGKIFNFDEDGNFSSSDGEKTDFNEPDGTPRIDAPLNESEMRRKKRKKLSREEEATGILKVVPEARSVAWFPLWDSSLERWYAGAIIWSNSVMRLFSPAEELTYMATFGNSIMAEVSRLSALVASQMKVDFMSSISHELRSPLHGILACAEYLKEDHSLSVMNGEMVDTINNCGQTLLQTIDHVLDFAQITKKVKEKTPRSRTMKRSKDGPKTRRRSMSNGRPMDLRVLTEEVIDSVYAGRRSWKMIANKKSTEPPQTVSTIAPTIIVDIDWRENWTFDMDDGAWRRILMNLFSNAVKYTVRGYVRVAISVEFDEIPGKKKPYPRLCLAVSDSGQGISQEFLKNHIYTAFKQEDSLSVGTGLGLSIVRQIILDLGGQIDIQSEVGVGTQAFVSIPLLPNKTENHPDEDSVAEVRTRVIGLRAWMINSAFDVFPSMSDEPTGILTPEAEALMLLKSSVRSILADWFGMSVMTSTRMNLSEAGVYITVSSETIDSEIHAQAALPGSDMVTVVVICSALSRNANYVTKAGIQVFYLQQPVSPHKFAAVLSHTGDKAPPSAASAEDSETPPQTSRPEGSEHLVAATRPLPIRQISSNSATQSSTHQPLRILLVEDNEINMSLLVKCVSKLHHKYVTATNGREAVDAFVSQGPFDVVVLDIQMPIMDGFAATKEIRTLERNDGRIARMEQRRGSPEAVAREARVKIIALTGASSAMAKQEAFSAGIDLYLVKPVSMRGLTDVLKDVQSRP